MFFDRDELFLRGECGERAFSGDVVLFRDIEGRKPKQATMRSGAD